MLFSSTVFIFPFLCTFFLVYFLCRGRAARNTVLLAFSLFFYAWGEPLYLLLMLFSIAFNYVMALQIEKASEREGLKCRGAKYLMAGAAAVNLAMLGVYKYTGFVVELFNALPFADIPVPEISLPIGISFYTFQILSYVIDVYRGEVAAQRSIVFLGAYLAAFPQLIAGPIVRYRTVAEELTLRAENVDEIAAGIRRFIVGLSKKVLIANIMAAVCDSLMLCGADELGALGAWLAALSYTLQIYFDFSGYSDMAIGLGLIMGFHYLENFNYPYIAVSVTEFWRRWHISLSTFFRDYVYIPLGGNRVSAPRWVFNMAVVWMLTGLWHGASMNFVLWGVYFGVLLVLEKLVWGRHIAKIPVLRNIYALLIAVYGWVIFRAESLTRIGQLTKAMFGGFGIGGGELPVSVLLLRSGVNTVFVITLLCGIIGSTPLPRLLGRRIASVKAGSIALDVLAFAALLFCALSLASGSYNPFIYFRF